MTPPSIWLDDYATLLVVLHAAASIVLIGACTHHALIVVRYLRGRYPVRLGRIYAATVAGAYLVTFALGLLAYPTFRYHVRALYLDRHAPWASNLFDIKENWAALGLPLVVAMLVLSRLMDPRADRALLRGYAAASFMVTAIVWFAVFSGFVITMTKGV
ncbi:MAG TPA: hypothetical protein VM734_26770 [Kofleriaceae bacterium]|jgi:hypothetical protein|nr:hypothetical protein [Kofleriaceae bacterium]